MIYILFKRLEFAFLYKLNFFFFSQVCIPSKSAPRRRRVKCTEGGKGLHLISKALGMVLKETSRQSSKFKNKYLMWITPFWISDAPRKEKNVTANTIALKLFLDLGGAKKERAMVSELPPPPIFYPLSNSCRVTTLYSIKTFEFCKKEEFFFFFNHVFWF